MAELIYLRERPGHQKKYNENDFTEIVDRIIPENAPTKSKIVRDDNVIYCIINQTNIIQRENKAVCMGRMIPSKKDWHKPGGPIPDGSFGIIRGNRNTIELISDMTGSRTIYYYLLEDLFVASTSQRAIMHFMESFIPDETAIAWMVSTGSLGPTQSWDERVKSLPPDTCVKLDCSSWKISKSTGTAWESFNPVNRPKQEHREQLERSIDSTFNDLELDLSQWTLPLSGGLDSRELLLRLKNETSLTTITWGTTEALKEPGSDAVRAQELANSCGIPHRYYTQPTQPENIETVFERFVTSGEGRIDHISGYIDNFQVFSSLVDKNV